jgi:cytochrome c
MSVKNIFFAFLLFFVFSCQDKETSSLSVSNRPNDPWVFRSVLDLKPRMLTLALHEKIWASFNTENASFYKAWNGVVYFDGSVYTQQHGPQPVSIGDGYTVSKYEKPWIIKTEKGEIINAKINYKGHKFVNNHVQLMYEVYDSLGITRAYVNEQVEAIVDKSVSFERVFNVKGLKSGCQLGLKTNVSSIVVKENIVTNGDFQVISSTSRSFGMDKTTLEIDGILFMKDGETKFTTDFMYTATVKNENIAGAGEEKEEGGTTLPNGALLIAKSDCKTCHNKNLKTVGPAYVSIAEKYSSDATTVSKLVQKVKNGGSGVWGNVNMTAHADLAESDITQMVEYILSLNTTTDQKVTTTEGVKAYVHASIDTNKLLPGAITKVYDIKSGISKMPDFSKLKLKQAGIKNNFDNVDGADFADLTDNFAITSEGMLYVSKPGVYTLEMWSDDGSKLYIHNELIIDNDGNHGVDGKFSKVKFDIGYHPFKFEYFQGGGGKFLSLNWIKPGEERAEVIPSSNILHMPDDKNDFTNLSLPFASVSKIPGNKTVVNGVHPAFSLTQARPDDFKPMVGGMDFMKDGSLIVSTWDKEGAVWKITNAQSGDPKKIKATRIAFGLAEPLGLKVVEDTIYVMQKQEITKLVDNNKDGFIDEYLTLCDDWKVSANFHEFGFGLEYKDGFFYGTLATAIQPGGASTNPQIPDRGKVIKVNRKTGALQFIASGLRTPNGIGLGYNNELFVADNQGDWLPSCKILHVSEGAWFGSRSVDPIGTKSLKEKPPVVWLPQDEIGNSPSTPTYINVGPYKGQMIHGEVTHGGVKRVFVEEVNGVLQGSVFRFTQGLEAGVNRIKWGPDGALYVGGIGNPGNWGHAGGKWYGLQRLAYNNKSVFEMLAVRAKANGVEIEFTEPVSEGEGLDPSNYEIKQWYYKPTIEYGGPKLGESRLPVKSVTMSADRKKAFLEISGLKANHVLYVHLIDGIISQQGNSLWSTEAWYTMNELSKENGTVAKNLETFTDNSLTAKEKADGWKLLFDGVKIDQFRNFKKQTIGKGWVVNDNAIHLNAVKENGKWQAKDGGDIITNEAYENYEFKIEWKITNCGNSGIIFNVVESDKYEYVWQTGPEMQVLDNTCHPDTRYVTHRAGDLYDMIESSYPCAKPAGQWNKAVIRSNKGKVDFYLNGYKTVSFTMHTDEWKKMIAKSKFKEMPGFGLSKSGHISLQDHGDKVWYKNIKIRRL